MRLLVVGGGPAGIAAALQARELGAEVTLVEARRVGGTTLNSGPAPVRTLARCARLVRDAGSWQRFGLRGSPPQVDLTAALANAESIATYVHETRRLSDALRGQGIDLLENAGPASFADPHTVHLNDGRAMHGDAIVVAVGGHAARPPIPGTELGLTYEDVRTLTALPRSVAVIGAADTGCQLASILTDFGVDVTLIEAGERVVPRADLDISDSLIDAFRRRGITVTTSTQVANLQAASRGYAVSYRSAQGPGTLTVDAVFFATGWPGNLEELAPGNAGINTDRGYITVGPDLRTSQPHILAAGDINGLSMLVPSARHEGQIAAENAVLGTRRRYLHEIVPTGSFTDPEYGSVGLTEDEARERYDCSIGLTSYNDLVRPLADGHPDGFCKLIVETNHRHLLGAHVLGEYSAEVIQMVAACMAANMRIEQIAELQPAFPTFTEAVTRAAQQIVRDLGISPQPASWRDMR